MSLTFRVVLRAILVMAFVIGGVALLTHEMVNVSGRNEVDRALEQEADMLARAVQGEVPGAAGMDGELSPPEAETAVQRALAVRPSGARHVAAVTVEGTQFQGTGGPADAAALLRGDEAPPIERGTLRTVDTPVGPLRVLDLGLTDEAGTEMGTVRVASPVESGRETANAVLAQALLAGAIGIAVGGAALWFVMRTTLGPLHALSAATREISPRDLTTRVPVPDDKDEIAELATDINQMLARIEDSDSTRRRYLAAVSHEIRTPLAVAEGHLEILGGEEAATVRAELERLRRVLDDLMAVARGGDEIDAAREPVFLPDLFDSVRARVGAMPYAEHVVVEDPPPRVLLGDQARLEQCLANLVDNAITHNPGGTRATVSAADPEGSVALTVADDGPGIAPEVLPHVFEPFSTTRSDGSGRIAGLGLAVVESLVRAMGGRVDADSGPSGTTMTLTLPRATA